MTETAIELVRRQLIAVTSYTAKDRGDWLCPAHADSTPSLSVNVGDDGRVLIHCQAGCSIDDVLTALELRKSDLFDEQRNGDRAKRELVGTYDYVDEAGALLSQVVRFRDPDGHKAFQQRRPLPDGGWEWKLGDTRRVLYRLPKVIAAVQAGEPVFVVEGEKDVAAVEAAGGVATCNAGGAGKWRKEYADVLRGAEVVIVADKDAPGIKHAADIEASLVGVAKRVAVVEALVGKDAADHLAAGRTLDDWLAALRPRMLKRVLLGPLMRAGVPDPVMVHDWLYAGAWHSIQGEPGAGKSWVAIWLTKQIMEAGYAVVYMDEEGGPELVTERLVAFGADPDMVDELLWYFPFPGRQWDDADVAMLTEMLAAIRQSVGMVVLDSLPDFLDLADKDENSGKDVTGFVRRILEPCREIGAALLVLDHLTRQPDSEKRKRSKYARGSGAKLAKAHLTMLLEAVEEFSKTNSGRLHLWATKDRRGHVPLPRLSKPPLVLDVRVEPGSLGIEVNTDAASSGDDSRDGWDGPTHCMDAVKAVLVETPGLRWSRNKMAIELRAKEKSYRNDTVSEALVRLHNTGQIGREPGARNAHLYFWEEGVQEREISFNDTF